MTPFDVSTAIKLVDPYGHQTTCEHAVRLGVSKDLLQEANRRGWFHEPAADRVAKHLGYHIGNVWPAYWEWSAERVERDRERRNENQRRTQAALRAKARATGRAA